MEKGKGGRGRGKVGTDYTDQNLSYQVIVASSASTGIQPRYSWGYQPSTVIFDGYVPRLIKHLTLISSKFFGWFELETIGMGCVLDLVRGGITVRC